MNAPSKHDCKQELRDLEMKATPARLAVLQLLEKAHKPLDVPSIISYLKEKHIKADPATIFRIINIFSDKGLVRSIHFNEDKFRYELASLPHHHHMVCTNCAMVASIEDCDIKEIEKSMKRRFGFTVERHHLEFFGLCARCQKL